MKDLNRPILIGGLLMVLLLGIAGWSTLRMLGHREAARDSAQALHQYTQLAAEIEKLRDNDAVKSLGGDAASQEQVIADQVTRAGQKLQLQGQWWEDTIHKSPRRVGNTPYMRKPAVLYTKGLTLAQITALLYELTYDSPLTAQELTLRTPPGEDPGDKWDANITLTYLVYEPQAAE